MDYEKVLVKHFDKGMKDNYFNATQLLTRLNGNKDKTVFVSGQPIYVAVEDKSGVAESYAEMATFDRERKQISHYAYYDPAKYRAELAISWDDEKRSDVPEDKVKLLKKKMKNALKTLAKEMTTDAISGTTAGGIIGVQTAVHAGTPATYGNINPATSGYEYWKNKYKNINGAVTLKTIMDIMTLASDGSDEPTEWWTDKFIRSYIFSSLLETKERYTEGKAKQIVSLPILYDKPVIVDAAFENGSDATGGKLYAIDSDSFYLRVHPKDDLHRWPTIRPANQFSFVTDWTWEGQLVCDHRRRLGVGYGITT